MNYFNIMQEYLEKEPSLQTIPVNRKAPFIKDWQSIIVTTETIESWESQYLGHADGFGLRAGQWNIGYMDVDTDDVEYIHRIDETMDLSQICVKRGKKGKTVFFRFKGTPPWSKKNIYKVKGDKKPLVEFNFTTGQTVLPPSLHPETGAPYVWVTQSLLDVDWEDLPIINYERIEYLETIIQAKTFKEGIKEVPTSIVGDGTGKWKTITSEASRLLHMGIDESTIARTLVGLDRQLFGLEQFFFSSKIGKDKVSPTNDIENATMWISTYKNSIMRTDPKLRELLSSIVRAKDVVEIHGDWGQVKPLLNKKLALEFPDHLFPSSCKDYCFQLSRLSNMPPEAFLGSIMTTFSAVSQGKVTIRAKTDFIVHPSISMLIIAPSGSRKDTLFDGGKSPLMKLVNRDKDKIDSNFLENEKDLNTKFEDIHKKKKKAISENDEISIRDYNLQIIELQKELVIIKKMRPNFIFESGTQERLYQLMQENQDRGIFLCSSEYVQLMGNLNKMGNEALRGFYLKLLNGSSTESFNHQTIGGVKVDIRKVFGCSLIGIQTDVFAQEIKNMETGKINDGLFQRYFLMSVNPEVKRMEDSEEEIDSSLIDNMFALLYDHPSQVYVTLDSEAKEVYLDYDFELRQKAQFDSSVIRSFRSKYSGQSVKISWILAQLDALKGTIVTVITKKYFLMAVEWLEWQSRCLDITWSNNNYNSSLRSANLILDSIKTGAIKAINFQNDVLRVSRMSAIDFNAGTDLLIENNYIRKVGDKFEVNPLL
jgi:hypothetical protein